MKRLDHQMMHGKAIWKPGIGEITKSSRGIAPGPKVGLQHTIWRANILTHTPFIKTQSFMTNWGQQKCLDKALNRGGGGGGEICNKNSSKGGICVDVCCMQQGIKFTEVWHIMWFFTGTLI